VQVFSTIYCYTSFLGISWKNLLSNKYVKVIGFNPLWVVVDGCQYLVPGGQFIFVSQEYCVG